MSRRLTRERAVLLALLGAQAWFILLVVHAVLQRDIVAGAKEATEWFAVASLILGVVFAVTAYATRDRSRRRR